MGLVREALDERDTPLFWHPLMPITLCRFRCHEWGGISAPHTLACWYDCIGYNASKGCADPTTYKVVKRELDSQRGIISQVIVASKASGLGPQAFGGGRGPGTSPTSQLQYVANVGLKVNHKLGGKNMQIRSLGVDAMTDKAPPMWSSKPTMLVGIDVSHPLSADPIEPSIVGLVASMDSSFAQ
jgi:hypothetical protein